MNAQAQEFSAMPDTDEQDLEQALDIKNRLEIGLRAINERIRRLQELIELKKQLRAIDLPLELETVKRTRQRNTKSPRELALLARDIIREAGRPMTRSELAEAIEARGIPLAGRDRIKNLGTILWRQSDLFTHVEDQGYWPAGDELRSKP
jgi:hypothetical protein